MPIALAMMFGGVWLVVSGWKGWTLTELFSDERPAGKTFKTADTFNPLGIGTGSADTAPSGVAGAVDTVAGAAGTVLLRQLADLAANTYGLSVRDYPPYDQVDRVHVPGSYHYKGRAFDASGPRMSAFANAIDRQYGAQLTELFWNGPNPVNRKNGRRVSRWFVTDHTDHVHVAI